MIKIIVFIYMYKKNRNKEFIQFGQRILKMGFFWQ